MSKAGASPKYLVCDKGKQFWNPAFKRWCKRRSIGPRYGAVGKSGSIALVERFIRSLKEEGLRRIIVPLRLASMKRELSLYGAWFNEYSPHQSLRGYTPLEVYEGRTRASEMRRFEPRERWPKRSRCAAPPAKLMGKPGIRVELRVSFSAGRKHLPLVELKRAA